MASKRKKPAGAPALDLIEEAVHLARHTPFRAWVTYYTGALPFVLGLLYFWSDMSRGAFAREHVVPGALWLAVLFVWMKCWQAVFAAQMRVRVAGLDAPRWTAARIGRMAMAQAILQPAGLFARPVAMLFTFPYGWVHAFYQNVIVFGDGQLPDVKAVRRAAVAQARLWPGQNHAGLSVLMLFGLFVCANIATAMAFAPGLLKSLLGVETLFSKIHPVSLLNSTFFASVCAAAYLCVDPLFKAFYVVRCFYGESLQSGADLRLEFARGRSAAAALPALAGAMLFVCDGSVVEAAESASAGAQQVAEGIAPAQLDHEIAEVLKKPEFSWRMPREPEGEKGMIAEFFDGAFKTFRRWTKLVREGWERFRDWIRGSREPREAKGASGFGDLTGFAGALKVAIIVLSAIALGLIAWTLWRRWRAGRQPREVVAEAIALRPDLAADDLVASQLPEEEWLKLSREMIEQGEWRLALRALYLAGLVQLGMRQMITIARHKSNREYEREVERRARTRDGLIAAFRANIAAFERVWYGRHPATAESIEAFQTNLDEIRAC